VHVEPYSTCYVLSAGFGFVGFDSEEVVEKLAAARFHTINGKSVCLLMCKNFATLYG